MGGLDLLLQLGEGIEYNSYVPFYDSMEVLNYKRYLSTLHEWVGGVNEIKIVPKIKCPNYAVGWGGLWLIETCLLNMQFFHFEGFPMLKTTLSPNNDTNSDISIIDT